MHERAHGGARAARGAATILGAVPLLIFATGLAVAGPPGQDMENATEPTPAAFPPQSGGSVAVQSFLEDDAALMAWLEAHNKDVLAAAARVDQAVAELARDRLFPNPSVEGTVSDIPAGTTNPPGLTRADTAVYGTVLSETVEIGKRGPRVESARLRLESERRSYLEALGDKTAEARLILGRVAYLGARPRRREEGRASGPQTPHPRPQPEPRLHTRQLDDFRRPAAHLSLFDRHPAARLRPRSARGKPRRGSRPGAGVDGSRRARARPGRRGRASQAPRVPGKDARRAPGPGRAEVQGGPGGDSRRRQPGRHEHDRPAPGAPDAHRP